MTKAHLLQTHPWLTEMNRHASISQGIERPPLTPRGDCLIKECCFTKSKKNSSSWCIWGERNGEVITQEKCKTGQNTLAFRIFFSTWLSICHITYNNELLLSTEGELFNILHQEEEKRNDSNFHLLHEDISTKLLLLKLSWIYCYVRIKCVCVCVIVGHGFFSEPPPWACTCWTGHWYPVQSIYLMSWVQLVV